MGWFSGQGPDWETPGAGEGRVAQWSGHEVGNPRVIGTVGWLSGQGMDWETLG